MNQPRPVVTEKSAAIAHARTFRYPGPQCWGGRLARRNQPRNPAVRCCGSGRPARSIDTRREGGR